MNFARYVFMLFILVCTSLNSSFLNKIDVKKFLNFLNPLATFQPSPISSGHAQYFEPINQLSLIQKVNAKNVLKNLLYFKGISSFIAVCGLFFEKRYKQITSIIVLAINMSYVYELKQFEKKLDQSLSDEKK